MAELNLKKILGLRQTDETGKTAAAENPLRPPPPRGSDQTKAGSFRRALAVAVMGMGGVLAGCMGEVTGDTKDDAPITAEPTVTPKARVEYGQTQTDEGILQTAKAFKAEAVPLGTFLTVTDQPSTDDAPDVPQGKVLDQAALTETSEPKWIGADFHFAKQPPAVFYLSLSRDGQPIPLGPDANEKGGVVGPNEVQYQYPQ